MAKCIIEECRNTISPRSQMDICPLCRQTLYRWRKRKPDDILKYQRNLRMRQDRMGHVAVKKIKKNNVVLLRRRAA